MPLMLLVVSLGLMLGTWAVGSYGWFLWLTRSYRRQRNVLVIGLGYIVVGISFLGSLFVLLNVLERMGVGHGTPEDSAAMWAFTLVSGLLFIVVVRSELQWRRSVGLLPAKETRSA